MRHPTHSRAAFGTLTMIGIIVGILLVTGIGQAAWRNTTQIGAYCRDVMLSVNFNAGLDFCDNVGASIAGFQRRLERKVGASSFGDSMNLEEFSGHLARQFTASTIGFNSPQLSGLINPQLLKQPNIGQANSLSRALTSGAYGSSLLGSGKTKQGLGYLQSSASMGEMGVLSQLQLGAAYSNGSGGIPSNPKMATHYYKQAIESLQTLQRSNSAPSRQLIGALPSPPQTLQKQLQQAIRSSQQ